jgi:hypothetical protein
MSTNGHDRGYVLAMYIGAGTIILILIIVVVVLMMRGR